MRRALFFITALIVLSYPAFSFSGQDNRANPEYDKETLLRIIRAEGSSFTVVQPGSEPENIKAQKRVSLLGRILNKAYEYLGKISRWLSKHFEGIPAFSPVPGLVNANWLIAALVIIVLFFFFFTIFQFYSGREKALSQLPEYESDDFISISMSKALERSELLAESNDFFGALKELLKGFFMGLDEINKVPYRKSRTNREYQRLIQRKVPYFSKFSRHFLPYMETILYAGVQAEPAQYYNFRDSLREFFNK